MSFVFYDTETTGTHTAFDQILQFAAIRTDDNLNEIDRFEVRCRLLPHVVPSPGAMRVTRVTIDQLLDSSLPTHYDMTCGIAARLREWSPAIFTGWNTIRFDETMLRQALFQNLHPPYLTNSLGNGRTDIMVLAQALSALKPGVLEVPIGPKEKPTFKLDQLAPANGFAHKNAHDALADVEATIHICRLIRDRAPAEWQNAISHSSKSKVIDFVSRETAFVLTECYFNRPHQFALAGIGSEAGSPGNMFAVDLRADIGALRPLAHAALQDRLSQSPRVVRTIRANAAPVLSKLDDEHGFAGLTAQDLRERARNIQCDGDLCARLVAAASSWEEREPSEHVEEQIYSAFSGRADEARMRDFHLADWENRVAIIDQFEDARLAELGRRLVFAHRPDLMEECELHSHQRWFAVRRHGDSTGEARWLTVGKALEEAATLLSDCDDEARLIMTGLQAHLCRTELAR